MDISCLRVNLFQFDLISWRTIRTRSMSILSWARFYPVFEVDLIFKINFPRNVKIIVCILLVAYIFFFLFFFFSSSK